MIKEAARLAWSMLVLAFCVGLAAGVGQAAAVDGAAIQRAIQARQIGADLAAVVEVSFRTLAAQVRCGRTLLVADPAAASSLTINAPCTRASPLVIKAREPLAAVITG